jgi:hypothetical protein
MATVLSIKETEGGFSYPPTEEIAGQKTRAPFKDRMVGLIARCKKMLLGNFQEE